MRRWLLGICLTAMVGIAPARAAGLLVLQSDFGDASAKVAAMKGVAYGIDRDLTITDLSHEIASQDVWTSAYQLSEVVPSWPAGTVFVALVDSASNQPPIVVKLKSGQIVVTPDNGTVTLLADQLGIDSFHHLDTPLITQPPQDDANDFASRDRFIEAGALLASGKLTVEQSGPIGDSPVMIPYTHAAFVDGQVTGTIPDIDTDQGDVATNIDASIFSRLALHDGERLHVRISEDGGTVWDGVVPFVKAPTSVPEGEALIYLNDENKASLAINMGSFADQNGIGAGPDWTVTFSK